MLANASFVYPELETTLRMELSRLKKSLQPSSEDHSSLLDEPEWSLGVIVVESTPRLITVREKTTLELTPTLVHLEV